MLQIAAIREDSERLKELVCDYQRKLTNQVETYNSVYMDVKEKLGCTRTKAHRLVRDGHMSEIIKQRQEITKELTEYLDVKIDHELMGKLALIPKGN